LGATPHPHRSLALCRSLPPVKVPTQAEADIAPPTSPTPAGFPETMAKKSFAWNFPRPKQWQKKAWLKFSSTPKRRAHDLSSGLDLKVPRELAAHFETFKSATPASGIAGRW